MMSRSYTEQLLAIQRHLAKEFGSKDIWEGQLIGLTVKAWNHHLQSINRGQIHKSQIDPGTFPHKIIKYWQAHHWGKLT